MSPTIALVAEPQVDLSPLTQKLWAERIAHRVVFNEQGQQCLLLAHPEDGERVHYWVEQWQSGEIHAAAITKAATLNKASFLVACLQAPISALTLLVLVGFFLWMQVDSTWTDWLALVNYSYGADWQGIVAAYDEGGWWILWRPIFLHLSLAHIVFNGLWWWILASKIERLDGALALLLLIALCGFAGNLAQWWYAGPNFGGASGITFGFLGFVGVRLAQVDYQFPRMVLPIMVGLMVLMIAADFIIPGLTGTAHAAHLGGLVVGLLLGKIYPIRAAS